MRAKHAALVEALTGRFDEHHGELISGPRHDAGGADVHALASQAVSRHRAQCVVAKAPDVSRPPTQSGTCGYCGRYLSPRQPREPLEPLLRVRGWIFGHHGNQVDAVQAESGHVDGPIARREGERNPHGAHRSIRSSNFRLHQTSDFRLSSLSHPTYLTYATRPN